MNSGPSMNSSRRRPVCGSSSMTSVPMMSEGIRSGVNWIRLKLICSVCAIVLAMSVFPSPGTPTMSACPRQSRAASRWSSTGPWPTTTRPISCRSRSRALRRLAHGLDVFVGLVPPSVVVEFAMVGLPRLPSELGTRPIRPGALRTSYRAGSGKNRLSCKFAVGDASF